MITRSLEQSVTDIEDSTVDLEDDIKRLFVIFGHAYVEASDAPEEECNNKHVANLRKTASRLFHMEECIEEILNQNAK